MKIKWLGHSCFLLTAESGTKNLTDPFDPKIGYPAPAVEADIITTSHNHYDHNFVQAVKGSFKHLNQSGRYEHKDINVTGTVTFHDDVDGKKRGTNIVFVFDIDGVKVCHCGDLGHIPSESQVNTIGTVDILLVPVGGTYTVDAVQASTVVELIKPAFVIPMHYKTTVLSFPIDEVDRFLKVSGVAGKPEVYSHQQEIEVTKANLKNYPAIVVLEM